MSGLYAICEGATTRPESRQPIERNETPTLLAAEAFAESLASNPDLLARWKTARAQEQAILRGGGLISKGEYAVQIGGVCMGDALRERSYAVADPALPVRSGDFALFAVRGIRFAFGKVFLGRLASMPDWLGAFSERPRDIYLLFSSSPRMVHAIAGQDLVAADRVVAVIDKEGEGAIGGGEPVVRKPAPEIPLPDDVRAFLAQTSRAPLKVPGSALDAAAAMLAAG